MTQPGEEDRGGRRLVVVILVLVLLLSAVDVLMLGLVVAFGPSGFGGDRTPTRSEEVRAAVGEVAGVTALVLGAAAVVGAVWGPLTRTRRRLVAAIVAAQAFAVLVVVWSTTA